MILRIALFVLIFYCEGTKSQSLKTSCNGDVTIDCTSKLIAISSVTFEEVNNCVSRASVTPPCNSSTAIDVVRTACQYKNYCRVKAADVTFGTACSVRMLLSVSYTCISGLQGERYLRPLVVTKSSVQLEWQKHSNEGSNTQYVIERRYVPASQPSAIAGLSFEGFGYVKFSNDPFDGGKKFKTKLSFRTSAPNGLLFVAFKSKSDWKSYAYLQLTNGRLKFAVKSDKGSVDLSTTVTLNDGQFHTVEAEKRDKDSETLKLTVDGTKTSKGVNKGKDIDVSVDSVYVGGLTSTQYVKPGVFSQTDGFIGCMNIGQLEDCKLFDLQKNQSYDNVRWITNGCPPAVQAGMHFRGTGYTKLTLSPTSSGRLIFNFRMRTSWSNGLLLAAYSKDKGEFLFFESRVNGLDLRYRKGYGPSNGPFLVRVRPRTGSLCDGAWHTVSLAIDTTSIVVTVDGVAYSTPSKITNVQTYTSDIIQNFYLGGLEHKGSSPTMVERAFGYGVNVTSYGGCLADFEVNGQLVDYVKNRILSLNVSFAGCPDFTWEGPTCADQVLHVGSKGKSEERLTDTNGVKAFTEYLYRVTAKSGSGAHVPSKWIVVRTGEDKSSSGPSPELEYDGSTGKGTFRWTGPPATVKDGTSYNIKYSEVYQGSTVPSSDLKFNDDLQDISLPYSSVVSPSTTYVFAITVSLDQGSVTSSYARITTNGRECRRTLYRGTYYRGTTSISVDGQSCLNWSELSTYSNLLALYPESGLGNHSYCRNPISENRTMPWCYTDNTGGCLNWTYCNIDECEDTTCYSSLDNGYGYRGLNTDKSCVSWKQFTTFPVSQYAAAGLGDHSYCRNPDPQTRSKPWCYESDGNKRDCSVKECTNDVSIVNYVCGGDSDGNDKCVFPFVYKGKRFFECTSFDRDAPWCSIKNDGGQAMKEWAYCLCPKPSISLSLPTYSPPVSGRIDGTCLAVSTTATPTTAAPSSVAPTTVSPTTSTMSATTTFSPTTSSVSPPTTSETSSYLPTASNAARTPSSTTAPPTASNAARTPSSTTAPRTTSSISTAPVSPTNSRTVAVSTVVSSSTAATTISSTTMDTATSISTDSSKATSTTTSLQTASTAASSALSATSGIPTIPVSPTNSRSSDSNSASETNSAAATTISSVTTSNTATAVLATTSKATPAATTSTGASSTASLTASVSRTSSSNPSSPVSSTISAAPSNTTAKDDSTSTSATAEIPSSGSSSGDSDLRTEATSSQTPLSATSSELSSTTAQTSSHSTTSPAVKDITDKSSGMNIGIGVGVGVFVIVVLVVVAVIACRKRTASNAYPVKEEAMEMDLRSSRIHSPSYAVVLPFSEEEDSPSFEYQDSSVLQNLSKPTSEYYQPVEVTTEPKTARVCQSPDSQDDGHYEVPVTLAQAQAERKVIAESKGDIYWEPATSEEKLYDQLTAAKFRVLERSSVELKEVLGTGEFGTVERGIWTDKDSKRPVVVAVKTLKSESKENKVKFLQEAAIMGQFSHRNVLVMYGVVLTGKPLMVVLEILPKGDLKQYLQSIASEDTLPLDLPARFVQMARDIAAGMEYLAKRCFVHRDLAARNVLLDEKLVCKIADFGLSRDLSDGSYYVTKGGQIPIRWTAPEAISFRKYSTSSDVWSYGIVLYEIWTVGKRPYGQRKNNAVIDLLETGYRLPPPPGCSYAIYELMIECWNPDHHKRPTFNAIATRISQPEDALLGFKENSESVMGNVGDALEVSQSAYEVLQKAYKA
ncbi:uncharacterized protein [Oscarella lobularis]